VLFRSDINPLIASPDGLLALDARVLIHEGNDKAALPKLAIRPYPNKYVSQWTMRDGTIVVIRPIKAEDEILGQAFHASLSDRTVYMRYLSPMLLNARIAHERLARVTHNDYDREIALVVEGDEDGKRAIFGIARLSKMRGTDEEGRMTMLIADLYQGKGLGKELVTRIIKIGRDEKIKRITSMIARENEPMKKLCQSMGFTLTEVDSQLGTLKAVLEF